MLASAHAIPEVAETFCAAAAARAARISSRSCALGRGLSKPSPARPAGAPAPPPPVAPSVPSVAKCCALPWPMPAGGAPPPVCGAPPHSLPGEPPVARRPKVGRLPRRCCSRSSGSSGGWARCMAAGAETLVWGGEPRGASKPRKGAETSSWEEEPMRVSCDGRSDPARAREGKAVVAAAVAAGWLAVLGRPKAEDEASEEESEAEEEAWEAAVSGGVP
mmetsp:Transcript_28743/g.76065  ORF Transcript_28743/g.76065 Transcript_28743/m.76065 type:complete len:219 (+) Transcript_28743:539-1195(+)